MNKVTKVISSIIITAVMCLSLGAGMYVLSPQAAKDPRVPQYKYEGTDVSGSWVLISQNGKTFKDLTPEEQKREVFIYQEECREEAIALAAKNAVVKITERDDITSLSNKVMQQLVKRPDVSLDFTFRYDNHLYNVKIPAGQAVDDDTDWYGPLYLIGKYGATVLE